MSVVCPRKNANKQPYNPGNPGELGQFNPQGPAFLLSDDPGLASKQTNYSVSRVGLIIGGLLVSVESWTELLRVWGPELERVAPD